jgi:hypothetical protein
VAAAGEIMALPPWDGRKEASRMQVSKMGIWIKPPPGRMLSLPSTAERLTMDVETIIARGGIALGMLILGQVVARFYVAA